MKENKKKKKKLTSVGRQTFSQHRSLNYNILKPIKKNIPLIQLLNKINNNNNNKL